MKKIYDIRLGGQYFTVNEDAYHILKKYLDDVETRLSYDSPNRIPGIERRLARFIRENMPGAVRTVDRDTVINAISMTGHPDTIGIQPEEDPEEPDERVDDPPYGESTRNPHKKLYRNMDNKMIGGVCSGIAAYFNLDPTLVRVLTVLLLIGTFSLAFWAYVIMWIIVPKGHLGMA